MCMWLEQYKRGNEHKKKMKREISTRRYNYGKKREARRSLYIKRVYLDFHQRRQAQLAQISFFFSFIRLWINLRIKKLTFYFGVEAKKKNMAKEMKSWREKEIRKIVKENYIIIWRCE